MPRGISRAKHPELYGKNGTTTTTKKTGRGGWKRGARKLGAATPQLSDIDRINHLQSYIMNLLAFSNSPNRIDGLQDEAADCFEIMVGLRKRVYGEPPQVEAQPTTTATQPPFVAPSATPVQPSMQ